MRATLMYGTGDEVRDLTGGPAPSSPTSTSSCPTSHSPLVKVTTTLRETGVNACAEERQYSGF
jgi:hypothetical protein